jgi:hypothetical protein
VATITPEQLSKLPKWAREEIERLQNRVSRLEDDLTTALGNVTPETRVCVRGLGPNPSRPLDDHATVQFKVGPGPMDMIEMSFNYDHPRGVNIRSGLSLHILPSASNSIVAVCSR